MIEQVETNIDALDFDFIPACEHSNHLKTHVIEQPAKYFIHHKCPTCPRECYFYLCQSGWDRAAGGLKCRNTDDVYERDLAWTILKTLGG